MSANGWDTSGNSNLDELQTLLRSTIMIRREKAMVLWQLPNKTRQIVPIDIGSDDLAELNSIIDPSENYGKLLGKMKTSKVSFDCISKYRRLLGEVKVEAAINYLKVVAKTNKKIVIFAWHKIVIEKLSEAFENECVVISGSTPVHKRQDLVDKFQTDKKIKVFVGNIKAAGVGITLTAAALVVFVELDWVPGNVSQAEDRVHRIGQKEKVLIQHLVVDGSLDINMAKALVAKQNVIDKAVNRNSAVKV